jgi:two-component system NarL family sensor kinase
VPRHGWALTAMILLLYGFVCGTALLVVVFRLRHVDEMARITASREELLAETMTASEAERRQIAESIHDGALQDVLAARRNIVDFLKTSPPSAQLERAVEGLHEASQRLREATFELHPAVLEQAGLGAAVEKLASVTADRSGITVTTDIDYPASNAVDPIAFGVARELLSNVERHSNASEASVKLAAVNGMCCLDVADNGIGINRDAAARRLAEGHIGLASHRARVEAADGTMKIIEAPVGAHIRVVLPLRP